MQYLYAFLIGGALCMIGQVLISKTKLTPARILVIYVTAGVILGAVGLYEPLVRFSGEGARIPHTGFGYALAKGAKEAVDEQGWRGILQGPLASAAIGVMTAVLSALAASLVARPKEK